jgi:hypothetical protein
MDGGLLAGVNTFLRQDGVEPCLQHENYELSQPAQWPSVFGWASSAPYNDIQVTKELRELINAERDDVLSEDDGNEERPHKPDPYPMVKHVVAIAFLQQAQRRMVHTRRRLLVAMSRLELAISFVFQAPNASPHCGIC